MPSVRDNAETPNPQRKSRTTKLKKSKEDEVEAILKDNVVEVHSTSAKNINSKSKQRKNILEEDNTGSLNRLVCEREYNLTTASGQNENQNGSQFLEITLKAAEETKQSAILIKPGDCVVIAGPNKQNFYAKILSFYKNQFSNQLSASVRWFFAANEIPQKLLPTVTHARELFLSTLKKADSVEVESILDLCKVKWIDPHSSKLVNIKEHEYFYRKSFCGKKIRDFFFNREKEPQISMAEQINGVLSPKRLRQTPSKYRGISNQISSHSSAPSTPTPISTKKIQQNSPLRSQESLIENKILTSPIAASGHGRFEASAVALDILNSDECDFDDAMSTSSKSSNLSKASEISVKQKKNNKVKKSSTVGKSKTSTAKSKSKSIIEIPEKVIVKDILVLRISKTKFEHLTVTKLKNDLPMPALRSSPRRASSVMNPVKLTEDDSDFDSEDSVVSSDDDSYEEKPSFQKSARRLSTVVSSKSMKRVKISDNKTTVTPIRIKMPRDKLPFIPARPTPKRSAKGNMEKSRERLHVSAIPECLPCRENEFQEIFTFVEGKIRSGGGGCMYVSGVPGTGKTATVREVMNSLRQSSDEGDLPEFTYIDINGMRLTEPRQAYVQLLLQLTGQKATTDHASNLLTKLFSQRRKTSTVVLADELDLLWTKKQDVLYHLFDWPTHRHARLIVVAIANTMDLPERILINRVASRLGLTRLTFRPYSFKQLQEIISSRLEGLQTFESDAIQLASRKVAAVSGDARRCLDICRRATEITEREGAKLVSIEYVHAALQEMFATPMIQAIRSCSKQEQLFLHAVVAEFRRSGMEEATLGRIIEQHTAISQLEGAAPIAVSTVVQISHRLASNRLILLEGGQRDLFSRVRLNVSVDDVLFSLKQ